MYDEESSAWKIPTVTRYAKTAVYLGGRGDGKDDVKTIPVSLPRISICECCQEST
jgi:hypothetical protein